MPRMILTSLKASLALLIVLSLSSCGAPKARQAWQEQAESFVKGYLDLHPEVAVKKGFHSYDGQVTDHSKEGIERRLAFFDRMQAGLIHVDLSSLNSEQRFEYRFIMQVIDAHIWSLRNAENWRYNVVNYEPSLDPSAYVEHNYADKAHRFNSLEMHLQ